MIRTALLLTSLLLAEDGFAETATSQVHARNSVVRIVASHRLPDFERPWLRQSPIYTSGSGFIVDDCRILTNFHVVLYADQVYVTPYQSSQQLLARVETIAPEVDLAILRIADVNDEQAFFRQRPCLERASRLPNVQDTLNVMGYPQTGTSLSITTGTVAALDFGPYGFANTCGLRIQITAALNGGNSGGPVLVSGKVAGIVSGVGENLGYVIPNEEIECFLSDIADGEYEGKSSLYEDVFQALANKALRAKVGLADSVTGVLVRTPFRENVEYPLKKGDVVTQIGGHPIDNYGLVQTEANLRLPFQYLVPKLASDDRVLLRVLRGGQELDIEVPLGRSRSFVIPFLRGRYPQYFVYGPLVLSAASEELAQEVCPFLAQFCINSPLISRRNDRTAFQGEQLVVVTAMLEHRITAGYGDPSMQVLSEVNGVPVRSLRHVMEILRDADDTFVEFEFAEKHVETLVFDREELLASAEDILADNGVRNRCSDSLRAFWP